MLFKVTTFHFDAFILHNFNSPNANLNKVVIPIGVLKIISFFNLNFEPKDHYKIYYNTNKILWLHYD